MVGCCNSGDLGVRQELPGEVRDLFRQGAKSGGYFKITVLLAPHSAVELAPARRLMDRELLYPEIADFADIERVLAAAIDRVDGAELLQ